MSNIQATVGRNVQFIGGDGIVAYPALVYSVNNDGTATLVVFNKQQGFYFFDAKEFDPRGGAQRNVFKLTWQGR